MPRLGEIRSLHESESATDRLATLELAVKRLHLTRGGLVVDDPKTADDRVRSGGKKSLVDANQCFAFNAATAPCLATAEGDDFEVESKCADIVRRQDAIAKGKPAEQWVVRLKRAVGSDVKACAGQRARLQRFEELT